MNISSAVGIVIAAIVLALGVLTSARDNKIFLDTHAILLVIGGTLAATLVSFSGKNIIQMVRLFFSRILGNQLDKFEAVIVEVVDLAKGYRENPNYLQEKSKSIKSPFLKEAIELMVDGGIDPKEIDQILQKRAYTHYQRYEQDAEMFKIMAKFPPAFGLLGAVLGMIALMQNLGSADAIKTVGPSMAVALVATFYGIAIANFIFIPLGENLAKYNKQDLVVRQMVIDGIKLIRAKKHPLIVQENLKSYLLPEERSKLKKVG